MNKEMYYVRPIYELNETISLPTCMYSMKNVHGAVQNGLSTSEAQGSELMEKVKRILKNTMPDHVTLLESQQEDILKKLALLKEQIQTFRRQLNCPAERTTCTSENPSLPVGCSVGDIVVYASPSMPPHGLLALRALWGPSLQLSSHCHSSVKHPVPNKLLAAFSTPRHPPGHQINIIVVWKQVGQHVQCVVSPTQQVPIVGEVNLLRLLSHLGPDHLRLTSLPAEKLSAADWVLDLVHQLVSRPEAQRNREFQLAFTQIAPKQQGAWLLNMPKLTVVDVALLSYFKSRGAMDCPPVLKEWLAQCNEFLP